MPKMRFRFRGLVRRLGGTTRAAEVLECSGSMVSLVCSGDRVPGRALATRIENISRKHALPILATAWT